MGSWSRFPLSLGLNDIAEIGDNLGHRGPLRRLLRPATLQELTKSWELRECAVFVDGGDLALGDVSGQHVQVPSIFKWHSVREDLEGSSEE